MGEIIHYPRTQDGGLRNLRNCSEALVKAAQAQAPDEDVGLKATHQKMRSPVFKYQKPITSTQKAKWALHKEKQFKHLIKDIDPLVKDPVELFPATKVQECQISLEEAHELQTGP